MRLGWRLVLVAALLTAVLSTCGGNATPIHDASASAFAPGSRTACAGGVPEVATNLDGAPADSLEQLQGTYENDQGFLALVWDGRKSIVIVETAQLLAWQTRLAPLRIAVARSCINPALLATVKAALARIKVPEGQSTGSGYDGLADAIFVLGVDPEVLLATMDAIRPGARAEAVAAIADGTLRIDSAPLVRGFP
jgi:hypothetical protein